jgi:hypothetical protein
MAPQQKRKSVLGESTHKLKQGSLFSFFSKKPKNDGSATCSQQPSLSSAACASTEDAAVVAPAALTLASSSTPASGHNESRQTSLSSDSSKKPQAEAPPLACKVRIGDLVQVYWEDDNEWYTAKVLKQRPNSNFFWLEYVDDDDAEWLDLSASTFRPFNDKSMKKRRTRDNDNANNEGFDDEMSVGSGEASAYEEESGLEDDEEEDEDQWMVSDAEDADEPKPPAKKKRLFKVTMMECKKSSAQKASSSPTLRTPKTVTPGLTHSSEPKKTPPLTQLSYTTPSASSSAKSERRLSASSSFKPSSDASTELPGSATKAFGTKCDKSPSPPMFVKGAVNPAGSHVHHHLRFLREPRDAKGRSPGEPDYDPRTLTVVEREWERVCGSKMTNAVVQWWDLKRQYFDTVLLFKTGT